MIEREYAVKINKHALNAILELSQILLNMKQNQCSQEKYEKIKKGVGLSIGEIQMGLLEVIYSEFPKLDDLNAEK